MLILLAAGLFWLRYLYPYIANDNIPSFVSLLQLPPGQSIHSPSLFISGRGKWIPEFFYLCFLYGASARIRTGNPARYVVYILFFHLAYAERPNYWH